MRPRSVVDAHVPQRRAYETLEEYLARIARDNGWMGDNPAAKDMPEIRLPYKEPDDYSDSKE